MSTRVTPEAERIFARRMNDMMQGFTDHANQDAGKSSGDLAARARALGISSNVWEAILNEFGNAGPKTLDAILTAAETAGKPGKGSGKVTTATDAGRSTTIGKSLGLGLIDFSKKSTLSPELAQKAADCNTRTDPFWGKVSK